MGGAVGALNFLEENLVSQLVAQHKDLRCNDLQVDRVDVVVGNPQEARKSIRLPVGLAVTIATATGIELVFFRIQDHLRRMGRARGELSLGKPALEIIGEAEQRLFERLFRSVKYERGRRQ
jgi:hypothetical protein